MAIVLKEDYRIVLNKFLKGILYTLCMFFTLWLIAFVQGGQLPIEWAAYGGLIIVGLQAFKKSLEQYKPEGDFHWFWEFLKVAVPAPVPAPK